MNGDHLFAIQVSDDSMRPTFNVGDYIIANPQKAFTADGSGKIGLVKSEGSYCPRKILHTDDGDNYILAPENAQYPTKVLPVTGATVFKIVAVRKDISDIC